MRPIRIGVLLSGTGRTLLNLLEHTKGGKLAAEIVCVISDRKGVKGLDHAAAAEIHSFVEPDSERTFAILREHRVDLVCLGGYLRLLKIPEDYTGRVLNIHPALLPKFGGPGFFGTKVHEAVLASGDRESGCTVHYCDGKYDEGPILLRKQVPVESGDTVETLADRVFAAECEAYPEAIRIWIGTSL